MLQDGSILQHGGSKPSEEIEKLLSCYVTIGMSDLWFIYTS
jgi:hypothetical protein